MPRDALKSHMVLPQLQVRTGNYACIEGGSGKGMVVAGGSDGCLRVYSVSFRYSAQVNLSAEVVFTELAFLVEFDGSEAHVCGINIRSVGTRIAPAGADGSITGWEKSSTKSAEWTMKFSHQLNESSNMTDESPDSSSCPHFDYFPVCLSGSHDQNNSLCLIASLRNGKFEVFRKPLSTH